MNIVYDALLKRMTGVKHRGGLNNWATFNAVCCHHNGESRPDSRGRGSLRVVDDICQYRCFNCKYKANWRTGWKLSTKLENLFSWSGMGLDEQRELKFKIWKLSLQFESDPTLISEYIPNINFSYKEEPLPTGAKPFSYWLKEENFNPNFVPVAEYVANRGDDIYDSYDYYWTPDSKYSDRVIIPFFWDNKIVGYTGRLVKNIPGKNRYDNKMPLDYIFNTQVIEPEDQYIFVCEGVFDAIAIGGISPLGDKMTKNQIAWINQFRKDVIVMCDRENNGGDLVEIAISNGWYVCFPIWGNDRSNSSTKLKDAADAVKEYGKTYTLLSMLNAKFNDKFQIQVRRQLMFKRLKK
jgi:hypothetical protein